MCVTLSNNYDYCKKKCNYGSKGVISTNLVEKEIAYIYIELCMCVLVSMIMMFTKRDI